MNYPKIPLAFTSLVLILVMSVLLSLFTGGTEISPHMIFDALCNPHKEGFGHTILWRIRIPRIVITISVGAGLAACGTIFQAILRNPLAEPYTLGVSGGGALGATISVCLGLGAIFMVGMCFLGCCLSILLVYFMASAKKFSQMMLILSGVILSFLFSSLVMLIFSLSQSRDVYNTIMWLMGNLSSVDPVLITICSPIIFLLLIMLMLFERDLNLLSLGEEKAYHLGLDAKKAKATFFIIASVITGVCVALSGIIGFVGLIIPHIMRKIMGPNHTVMLPACVLAGASFLLICDTCAQILIRPLELPVGVITGIIGAVFFIALLMKSRDWEAM